MDDDTIDLGEIPTLDIATVTLREMWQVEEESGRSFDRLLMTGNATRKLLALWVAEQRARRSPSSAPPRSWHELSSLRPLGSSSSTSPAPTGGRSPMSSD